ncbi:MAG: bifunctional diaminohydroxyphosphoribosylaminopyrimidine deaminase/5-amino-6-(5-phosphoribosylamino)uracil reductase RibD, partial [Actinobacteria bacterium]|nr:bifunctional diaminohydroxyphosphoribosylaminopyrimidine deaminase/5-amino-6-(5-phosphoribosylamino)uracil reductase RibD [Actinomycetota bacterium]
MPGGAGDQPGNAARGGGAAGGPPRLRQLHGREPRVQRPVVHPRDPRAARRAARHAAAARGGAGGWRHRPGEHRGCPGVGRRPAGVRVGHLRGRRPGGLLRRPRGAGRIGVSPPGRPSTAERTQLIRACELAQRARGHVSPNPSVGAVIIRGDEVVGEGWHDGPGLPHAEPVAIAAAGDAARGATLVCTLEPCSHTGRTGPCTQAIIDAGIARVVVGALDPLERTRGEGVRVLQDAGIEVAVADGEDAVRAREAASAFLTWAATGRPEVLLKMAASLDGRVATRTGNTRWISGPEARALVHRWRAESDAVAVGIGTAVADDPMLTARDVPVPGGRVALRV